MRSLDISKKVSKFNDYTTMPHRNGKATPGSRVIKSKSSVQKKDPKTVNIDHG